MGCGKSKPAVEEDGGTLSTRVVRHPSRMEGKAAPGDEYLMKEPLPMEHNEATPELHTETYSLVTPDWASTDDESSGGGSPSRNKKTNNSLDTTLSSYNDDASSTATSFAGRMLRKAGLAAGTGNSAAAGASQAGGVNLLLIVGVALVATLAGTLLLLRQMAGGSSALLDGLCAPAMPGSVLQLDPNLNNSQSWEAPWWWSAHLSSSKATAFAAVCRRRPRVRLHLERPQGDKDAEEESRGTARLYLTVTSDSRHADFDAQHYRRHHSPHNKRVQSEEGDFHVFQSQKSRHDVTRVTVHSSTLRVIYRDQEDEGEGVADAPEEEGEENKKQDKKKMPQVIPAPWAL